MAVLKETLAVCPKCFKEIPATVYEGDDGIYIKKECDDGHGAWDVMYERSKKYYLRTMQKEFIDKDPPHFSMGVSLTHACNLKCYYCYAPDRETKDDLPPEKIKEVIREFHGDHIFFTGGEPTLSPHLPEFIKTTIEAGKGHAVLTNGVKLEDKEYLQGLADAGLDDVVVPLYGFDDDIYELMTGRRLLKNRMAVLKNLKDVNIPICLSFTFLRGHNEDEFLKILELALRNADHVHQIRMRSVSPAGSRVEERPFFVSEYCDAFARAFHVDPEEMIEFSLNESPYFKYTFPESYKSPRNPAHFELHIINFLKHQAAKGNRHCANLLKLLPRRNQNDPDFRMRPETLFLNCWNWATLESADLMDFRNLVLGMYTYNLGEMSFLEATLMSGRTVDI